MKPAAAWLGPTLLVLVSVGVVTATTPARAARSGAEEPTTAGAGIAPGHDAGRLLFVTGCSSCHGRSGEGTAQAPSLIGVGAASADYYLSTGRMPLDQPQAQADRKRPAYDKEQIRLLVEYVGSLGGGPGIPTVDPSRGDLSEGNQLYAANCAACHNSAGSGGALGRDFFAPALTSATPRQVAEAVRIGPGAMPQFGAGTIDEAELASIIRYVEYLKHPRDRGGAPLGRVGPMPEGLVAWLVGLGTLLLATFWIGTRR